MVHVRHRLTRIFGGTFVLQLIYILVREVSDFDRSMSSQYKMH